MKRFFFFIFLLLIPTVCFSQPSIEFDKERFDFGEVSSGMIEHSFEVTNTGTEDLIIEEIIPS